MDEKKRPKKKKDSDDDTDENEEEDENNIQFDDEFFDIMNSQMKKVFKNFPGVGDFDFNSDMYKKMFKDIFSKLNLDPKLFQNADPEMIKKMMRENKINFQGPFVYGMNMRFGPDGKPVFDSFGHVKETPKASEDPPERDPLIDIYEEEENLVVVCEVPGVEKDQIELRAAPREIEILADNQENGNTQRKYHKMVPLPVEILPDYAKARYQNGILEIKLRKADSDSTKKKINID